MTSLQAQGKLIGMAKEKSLLPWDRIVGAESDTIRFKGCTFFFFDNFAWIWSVNSDELETAWYSKVMEADFIRWVNIIEAMKEVE